MRPLRSYQVKQSTLFDLDLGYFHMQPTVFYIGLSGCEVDRR